MKVTATIREVIDTGSWERYCEYSGMSLWAVNEGLDDQTVVTIPVSLAFQWGMIDEDI